MAYDPPQPEDILRPETMLSKVRNSLDFLKGEVEAGAALHGAYDIQGLTSLVANLASQVAVLSARIDGLAMQQGSKGGR